MRECLFIISLICNFNPFLPFVLINHFAIKVFNACTRIDSNELLLPFLHVNIAHVDFLTAYIGYRITYSFDY